jgi:23S rRNA (adenine-N6)-dimethyltransferase
VGHGDLVLDIGAGTGAVTDALIGTGAKVIAVELHRQRVLELRARYDRARVTVVQADAGNLRLPRRPFAVVANPPFAILHPLMRRLLAPGTRLTAAHLVVPRYVAELWTGPSWGSSCPTRRLWGKELRES